MPTAPSRILAVFDRVGAEVGSGDRAVEDVAAVTAPVPMSAVAIVPSRILALVTEPPPRSAAGDRAVEDLRRPRDRVARRRRRSATVPSAILAELTESCARSAPPTAPSTILPLVTESCGQVGDADARRRRSWRRRRSRSAISAVPTAPSWMWSEPTALSSSLAAFDRAVGEVARADGAAGDLGRVDRVAGDLAAVPTAPSAMLGAADRAVGDLAAVDRVVGEVEPPVTCRRRSCRWSRVGGELGVGDDAVGQVDADARRRP